VGNKSSEHDARFEDLFLPELDAAYNLARWMVGGDQNAQDIVEEAHAHALKGFSQFPGDNPRAWLLTIVRSTAYSWIKKKQRYQDRTGTLEEEVCATRLVVASGEQSRGNRREILERALSRLPAEFREVLVLFEIESWSYSTIAVAIDLPLETVRLRLRRARQCLQAELARRDLREPADS
jgi:RNA polymerase sigma-70 factor, ECF subfamily